MPYVLTCIDAFKTQHTHTKATFTVNWTIKDLKNDCDTMSKSEQKKQLLNRETLNWKRLMNKQQ